MGQNQSSRSVRIFLPIFSVLGAILLFEFALKLIPSPTASPEFQFWNYDSELGWSHQKNTHGIFENQALGFQSSVKLDEFGLRDNENPSGAPAEKTVLVIGDSVVAGFEVNGQQTFCSLLERKLQSAGHNVRVLNGGVRGYGSDQDYLQMKRMIPRFKPDLVLYVFSWNDLFDNLTIKNRFRIYSKPAFVRNDHGELQVENLPPKHFSKGSYEYIYNDGQTKRISGEFQTTEYLEWMRQHSHIYSTLEDLYFRYIVNPPNQEGYEGIDERYVKSLFKSLLSQMAAEAPRLLVTSFVSDKVAANDKVDVVRETSRELGIEFLDLRPHFVPESDNFTVPNDGHWNARGHRAAADGLFDYFRAHHGVGPARTKTAALSPKSGRR